MNHIIFNVAGAAFFGTLCYLKNLKHTAQVIDKHYMIIFTLLAACLIMMLLAAAS